MHGKRTLDLIISVVLLITTSPILLVIAAVIRLRLGRPILFQQERAGISGRPFIMYKFRTMTTSVDDHGRLLPDVDRLTPLGRWLRSTSLDELPELWNVARGEMSLVGPRPLPVHYLPRYTPHEARRHGVRPGVTGWAQVNGRNTVDWDTRMAMDLWYLDHRSLRLDLRIMAMTVLKVICRMDIATDGYATGAEFRPNTISTGKTD